MRPGAASLVLMADDTRFAPGLPITVTIRELRDIVYEMRYAQSQAESAALALAEREAGEDADGNLLSSAEDYAVVRGHEYVHIASCPCPQNAERWAHRAIGDALDDR